MKGKKNRYIGSTFDRIGGKDEYPVQQVRHADKTAPAAPATNRDRRWPAASTEVRLAKLEIQPCRILRKAIASATPKISEAADAPCPCPSPAGAKSMSETAALPRIKFVASSIPSCTHGTGHRRGARRDARASDGGAAAPVKQSLTGRSGSAGALGSSTGTTHKAQGDAAVGPFRSARRLCASRAHDQAWPRASAPAKGEGQPGPSPICARQNPAAPADPHSSKRGRARQQEPVESGLYSLWVNSVCVQAGDRGVIERSGPAAADALSLLAGP